MATETLEAPPAAAPETPPASTQPAQAAKTTISVSQLPGSATPAPPPKPGSAKERLFEDLRKKAKPTNAPPEEPAKAQIPSTAKTPETEPTTSQPVEGEETAPATEEKTGKKPSPWKLMDQWKERAIKAEAR